ncbi:hypothetical protein A2767_07330 [Candidatus Roizmanbacteria bacterium RIFCSPHIGHO2_01_FULL_35_10]|uniref:Uncharacterized protein n=1 Tax=Candidatus Roizmanbacteria bacterium RIFCSPLOWO2_01_FULL_35_13 TaxID=1802055 RepID=A0A1F7IDD3_9BACT|nr:MAG: hypothetical protein A2767_07330 [Candidatus Roizmanbacteria bacterium RIFCSPHIGHO2_01_FULL_35_10]OGK41373.1 MAG: hypothetical protein A3A74_03510 [Candidatus Roizmanbacteria bacterium RIFCSPLOWO2_01_FULL_35_13]
MLLKKNTAKIIFILFLFIVPYIISAQEFPPPDPLTPTSSGKQKSMPPHPRVILLQKLKTITDTIKAEKVADIFMKLADINQQRTGQMQDVLDRMNAVLQSLLQKIEQASAGGVDITLAQQAANEAQAAFDVAQAAVASQSAKVFTLDATNEATLKPKVGQQVSQLQADLQAVRSLVIEAKHKISAVIRELAKTGVGKIGQKDKSATSEPALFQPFIP